MSNGYWIVRVDVSDQDQYKLYAEQAAQALRKYGGRFLARAGKYTLVEGETKSRNTVVQFPSYQAALACWNSSEYQAAAAIRRSAAVMDLVIVEGYVGPQPS